MIYVEESAKMTAENENKNRWVSVVDDDCYFVEWHCSNCGSMAEIDGKGDWILSKYCHNCGKKMENANG